MTISDKDLCKKTDDLFQTLTDLKLQGLLLTTLGNSISTGFSFNDINGPLLDRDKFLEISAKIWGIDLEKHKFSRSENNSDQHVFDWIINNISEDELDRMNKRDYLRYLKHGNELLKESQIKTMYDESSKSKIQDVLFNQDDSKANIVIYNGATGSFLDNWTRKGIHLLTGRIKKDISYIDAILGIIQNNNRKTNSKTQVYLCGAPKIVVPGVTNTFINRKLKQVQNRYANTSYVPNFNRKPFYNVNGLPIPDPHYSKKEYIKLIYLILDSIIKNYRMRDYLIEIDRNLYNRSKEIEMSMEDINTKEEVLDTIRHYADLLSEDKEEFLKMCRKYLLERYCYDFCCLDHKAIKDEVKELKNTNSNIN